jgi:large subunit ribosomal protein L10
MVRHLLLSFVLSLWVALRIFLFSTGGKTMPSASVLEKNKAIVSELSDKVKAATAGVIVSYQGITVENDTALRASLRKAGVEYKVYKNTFAGMALEANGYGALKSELNGMTAIALTTGDEVAPAKILKEYADKVETFQIKAGFVDGEVMNADQMLALAAVPSKPVLVGKVLGGLMSPVSKMAMVLQAIIDKQSAPAEEAPAAE